MLYTSAPLSRMQSTSLLFKDKGIQGEAPVPVGESRISIVATNFSTNVAVFLASLWAVVASYLLGTPVSITKVVNGLGSVMVNNAIFQSPPLVCTFSTVTRDIEEKMTALGFTKQAQNRYTFFKGPASNEAIQEILKLGGNSDCYAPYGSTNLSGIVALSIINRILVGTLGVLAGLKADITLPESFTFDAKLYWREFAVTGPESLGGRGVFFHYFDGLVLPDKASTVNTINGLFSRMMGANAKGVLEAAGSLSEGWMSLSTTSQGLAISHLVYGIDLAIKGQTKIRPVIFNNEYVGFLLEGSSFAIVKGSTRTTPYSKEIIAEEFLKVDAHSSALKEIAEILSNVDNDETKKRESISIETLTSGRAIHQLLRKRSIIGEDLSNLRKAIMKLQFRTTFWDTSDKNRVAKAIECIVRKEFLPESAPFDLKGVAMLTKDPILSTLSAFGVRAPTLIGFGNNASLTLTKGGSFYKDFKPASLQGVPIFYKPLQQAFEEWTAVLASGVVYFKHLGNDKSGKAKIASLGQWIPFDSSEYKRIINGITDHLVVRITKRKRGSEDNEGESSNIVDKGKKVKKAKLESAGLLALMPIQGMPSSVGEPDDEEMDF